MDVVVYDDEDRRYVPAAVALLLAVLVALLAAGLAVLLTSHRQGDVTAADQAPAQAPAPVGTSSPEAGQAGDAVCAQALARGDAALERAVALSRALGVQTTAIDELLARRITSEQLLARSLPVLTTSSTDRKRFTEELAAYQRSRSTCGSGG